MLKTLAFSVALRAPRDTVWRTMLTLETYRDWTSAFCDGSTFEGSWEAGSRIRFLDPKGSGMVSEIAEHRPAEFVSIRHLGEIAEGVEDTTSEKVRAWAPAHENYTFTDEGDGTRLDVAVEILPEYESYMLETYPRALDRLKALCERGA